MQEPPSSTFHTRRDEAARLKIFGFVLLFYVALRRVMLTANSEEGREEEREERGRGEEETD